MRDVGFEPFKCKNANCTKHGMDMSWCWRNVFFDPDTNILTNGKIYNYCTTCKQKISYVFFPFLLGENKLP